MAKQLFTTVERREQTLGIKTVSTHCGAPQHKHQSIHPFCIQFWMIMSHVAAFDGEINLALIEICQFQQAVMDVIYHSGQICG